MRALPAGRALVALLALLGGAACGPVTPGLHESAIYDGEDARAGYDSVVRVIRALSEFNGSSCSGTVVAPRVVVTAKHCLVDIEAYELEVQLGPDGESGSVAVDELRATEGPSPEGRDFAVLLTAQPLEVFPISPYATAFSPEEGQPITLVGFGRRENDFFGRRTVGDTVLENYSDDYFTTTGDSACYGDSGGAAFDADGVLVGVITHVLGLEPDPCLYGRSGITRVDAWAELVDQAILDTASCSDEVCENGWDDDCDDAVDEGCLPMGSACASAEDCASRDCRALEGASVCTEPCDPERAGGCQVGFWCAPQAEGGACVAGEAPAPQVPDAAVADAAVPDAGDTARNEAGCGCHAPGGTRAPAAIGLMALLLVLGRAGPRARRRFP